MGSRLQVLRRERGWSQMHVVLELEIRGRARGLPMPERTSLKTQLSRWENGHVNPHEPYCSLLAEIYGATEHELGFARLPGDTGHSSIGTRLPTQLTRDAVTFLDDLLQRYARADNAIGPATLLAVASQHVISLEPALVHTRGPLRSEGLRLCSRFAEFAGWLSQDAGDLDAAQQWTDRALDFVEELDDPAARAYVLMRKSGIAADRRESARCVTLAVAASHHAAEQAPRLRALTLRQAAIAQAIVGDRRASQLAAGRAIEAVAAADSATNDFDYVTEAYVTMEAGVSSFHLQRHDEAAERLARAAGRLARGVRA